MAQITNDMCDHIIAAADRGEKFPLTVDELRQLAYLSKEIIQVKSSLLRLFAEKSPWEK